ncbi:N-acetylmuramoyl-L-alanine amidase [Cutibacterium avidum]|nr:peptidoglycan recognition family protein [Cutibacterium avidum]QQY11864.1 N-acetylmuramoyl-L-alanine amidase [Cutibacterium avidum]
MTYIPAAHHGPTTNAPVSRIVIHSTCPDVGFPAASKAGRAVSTANYFASTSRPASAHYVVDIATTVQCLPENTVGYHAPPNSGSIGIEICSDGGSKGSFENPAHAYTTTQWLSPEVWPAVERAAILAREICHRHHIPIRRLSVAQVRAGERGICGHNEVSEAFHRSDHDDPGPWFPWDRFILEVKGIPTEGMSMSDIQNIIQRLSRIEAIVTVNQRRIDKATAIATENQRRITDIKSGLDHTDRVAVENQRRINRITAKLEASE